jgi:S-adenosylmethionine synthetase
MPVAPSRYIFSSESVSEGHPDKIADQVSDAILDALLTQDPLSRVACETLVKNDSVVLAGEISSQGKVDYKSLVRDVIREIGYTDQSLGFSAESCDIISLLSEQSSDISQGVDRSNQEEQGAGDQGIMFGFACDETEDFMPLPIFLSHKLVEELATRRKQQHVDFLRPDAKSQVTVQYHDGVPESIHTVVLSTQHSEEVSSERVAEYVIEEVIKKVVPQNLLTPQTRYLINPTGRFVIGGPVGDCGLTGRKIIVDTYGGYSRHGGGAFSGKDPSKVDRSAAYAARYIAKNIVSAKLARKCEVQLAYAIGVAAPVSIFVDTFGTSSVPEGKVATLIGELFSLTPRGITESLKLNAPIYRATAAYGHFGRKPSAKGHFSWERTDKTVELLSAFGK